MEGRKAFDDIQYSKQLVSHSPLLAHTPAWHTNGRPHKMGKNPTGAGVWVAEGTCMSDVPVYLKLRRPTEAKQSQAEGREQHSRHAMALVWSSTW